jgi:hypothetical protein
MVGKEQQYSSKATETSRATSETTRDSTEIFELVAANKPLLQGDILFLCPYLYPIKIDMDTTKNEDEREHRIWTQEWNVIVLGHSCDIDNTKIDLVLICPIWEINSFFKNCAKRFKKDENYRNKFKGEEDFKSKIMQLISEAADAKAFGYAILKGADLKGDDELPEIKTEPMIVDFTNTYTLPLDFLNEFAKTDKNNTWRLRLKTEYRADLMAKFSYFLSRAVLSRKVFDYKTHIKPIIKMEVIDKILNGEEPEKK